MSQASQDMNRVTKIVFLTTNDRLNGLYPVFLDIILDVYQSRDESLTNHPG